MNIRRSAHRAGKDTSKKGYVLIAILIAVLVLPRLYGAWCSYGWPGFP